MEIKEIDELISIIINSLTFLISFLTFFNFIIIFKIHCKIKIFRVNYFRIVFTIIILEIMLRIIIIIESIFQILDILQKHSILNNEFKKYNNLIFSLSFNFLYITIIFFNIRTIYYLYHYSTKDLDLINQDMENSVISLKTYSFTNFYIISFFLGIIHTILFFLYAFLFNENFLNNWFFNSISLSDYKTKIYELIFFFPNIFFFIYSIPYLKICWNKENITDKILLKGYSQYCFIYSFLSLIYPIIIIILLIFNDNTILKIICKNVILMFLNIQLYLSSTYRINCVYIKNTILNKEKKCYQIIKDYFIILFTNQKIKSVAVTDFNNTFVTHALTSEKDINEDYMNDTSMINMSFDDI